MASMIRVPSVETSGVAGLCARGCRVGADASASSARLPNAVPLAISSSQSCGAFIDLLSIEKSSLTQTADLPHDRLPPVAVPIRWQSRKRNSVPRLVSRNAFDNPMVFRKSKSKVHIPALVSAALCQDRRQRSQQSDHQNTLQTIPDRTPDRPRQMFRFP